VIDHGGTLSVVAVCVSLTNFAGVGLMVIVVFAPVP
jgi:hypothetical protein